MKSLYTKYRPQNFSEVAGQSVAKAMLINSLKHEVVNHAYIFYGQNGVGKTTLARVFSKALNCENIQNEYEPCNSCSSCNNINNAYSVDVIEIDAASHNGVDEIRSLNEKINFATTSSKYKIYIIDEVHMFSKSAFNALLKTLEEPPKNVIFMLASTEIEKIPDTIISRSININLKPLSLSDTTSYLKHILDSEETKYEDKALDIISKVANGSLREAITTLQLALLYDNNLTYENVLASLEILDKDKIVNLLKNNVALLIEEINKDTINFSKTANIVLEALISLVSKGYSEYSSVLENITNTFLSVSDPNLIRLVITSHLTNFNVSRKTNTTTIKPNKESIEGDVNISKEHYTENSLSKKSNISENQNTEKEINIEENLVNNEKKQENQTEDKRIITGYLDKNDYLTVIFNSIDKLIIKRFITKIEQLEQTDNDTTNLYIQILKNNYILAMDDKAIVLGFRDLSSYENFVEYSLQKDFMSFIEDLFNKSYYVLPITAIKWNDLLKSYNVIKINGKKINKKLEILEELKSKNESQELENIFDRDIEIK